MIAFHHDRERKGMPEELHVLKCDKRSADRERDERTFDCAGIEGKVAKVGVLFRKSLRTAAGPECMDLDRQEEEKSRVAELGEYAEPGAVDGATLAVVPLGRIVLVVEERVRIVADAGERVRIRHLDGDLPEVNPAFAGLVRRLSVLDAAVMVFIRSQHASDRTGTMRRQTSATPTIAANLCLARSRYWMPRAPHARNPPLEKVDSPRYTSPTMANLCASFSPRKEVVLARATKIAISMTPTATPLLSPSTAIVLSFSAPGSGKIIWAHPCFTVSSPSEKAITTNTSRSSRSSSTRLPSRTQMIVDFTKSRQYGHEKANAGDRNVETRLCPASNSIKHGPTPNRSLRCERTVETRTTMPMISESSAANPNR